MIFWLTFFLPGGLGDSVILANDASKISQLNTWLLPHLQSQDRSYWKLCYRASNHGWSSQTFHSYCDNKGPTVTIVRVGIYIFGGYNDNSWQCKSLKYRKIPKISPSMYKLSKYKSPKPETQKTSAPRGMYLENCPQIQGKTKQKR